MEKFVTDLDKLLDDFENSNDGLNCNQYDSSGYNSPRVCSNMNNEEADLGRQTPTLTSYESFVTNDQLTPTENGSLSINIEQSSVICLPHYDKNVSNLDETILIGDIDLTVSSLIEESCASMNENEPRSSEHFTNIAFAMNQNVENNITINSLSGENGEISIGVEVGQNTEYSPQTTINGQADKRRTDGDFIRDHGSIITMSPNHSLVPPRKKSRPNSLLGLSSVINSETNCEEKTVCHSDHIVLDAQTPKNSIDNLEIHSTARRPHSLNLGEDVAVNSIMFDADNECEDHTNEVDIEIVLEDKVSENSLSIHQFDSVEKQIDEASIWQGIPVYEIGLKEPVWISDDTSFNCMQCDMPFSMFRRRHHCRACGRLLCNKCCCWRMQLHFSSKLFPKDRVCAVCFQYLIRVEAAKKHGQSAKSSNFQPLSGVLKSNRPTSLTISPNSVSSSSNQLVPDFVEASNTLKSVMFADGIRPGGDLMESDKSRIITPTKFQTPPQMKSITQHSPELTSREPSLIDDKDDNYLFCQCKENLIFHQPSEMTNQAVCENNRLIFPITRNLNVHLQIIKLPYCTCSFKNQVHNIVGQQECDCDNVDCWFFASIGLETIGLEEIVVVLRRQPDEISPPIDILKYYFQVFQRAFKNETKIDNMEMTVEILSENNNQLSDWAGILHIRPTFQCLSKIPTIRSPFLIGLLIHRWELPWAMLLPLRLVLALGNQSRFYPCSIVSDRNRPSVYGEVGQTILQLVSPLFAFSNYFERGLCDATIVPTVPGMWLHLIASQETIVQIPKQSYSCMLNILSSRQSENSPLALAASFSREADSHLVCCQNEETGKYFSTAISIQNTERTVTATTMILFVPCRDNEEHGTTIVEDAIVVKLSQMHLGSVLNSIRTMSDLALQCGSSMNDLLSKVYGSSPSLRRSMIKIVWTDSQQMCDMASIERTSFVTDETVQSALGSLRNGGDKIIKSHRVPSALQNVSSDKENQSPTNPKLVWTRFHMVETGNSFNDSSYDDPVDLEEIIREIAYNFANSINPFLDMLRDMKLVKIGLRTKIGCDSVDWLVGCSKKYEYILTPDLSPVDDSDPRNNSFVSSKMKNDHKVHFNNVEEFPEICRDYLNEVMVPFIYSKTALLRNGYLISELEFHIID